MTPTKEELEYLKKLKKVIKDRPKNTWFFAKYAEVFLMRGGEDKLVVMKKGYVDFDNMIGNINMIIDSSQW